MKKPRLRRQYGFKESIFFEEKFVIIVNFCVTFRDLYLEFLIYIRIYLIFER